MKTQKVQEFIKQTERRLLNGLIFSLFMITGNANAQSFVYRPINPSFGGSSYNYSWLLSSAEVQNTYKKSSPTSTGATKSTPSSLDTFSDNINKQILSKLSSQFLKNQFGEESLKEGTYQYGDLRLDVTNGKDGINIRIIDNKGGETVITIPYY
jgi:curli production assembly/transport component CsgF